jgi:hypothetical protein
MQVTTAFEQLFFTTVRVETSGPNGQGTGTAFGFLFQRDEKQWPFLVTNRHVITGAQAGKFFFTLSDGQKPLVGQRLDIDIDAFEGRWHCHPTADIAVMPYMPLLKEIEKSGQRVYFQALPDSIVPSQQQLEDLDAVEEVFFVGYPNGIYDQRNLLPIVRRGTTATPPQLDYNGTPTFLIDASVFGGSSGSPVLICRSGGFDKKNTFVFGQRIHLLGVVAGVAVRRDMNRVEFINLPTVQVPIVQSEQVLNLGHVFKSSTVLEAVTGFLRQMGQVPAGP